MHWRSELCVSILLSLLGLTQGINYEVTPISQVQSSSAKNISRLDYDTELASGHVLRRRDVPFPRNHFEDTKATHEENEAKIFLNAIQKVLDEQCDSTSRLQRLKSLLSTSSFQNKLFFTEVNTIKMLLHIIFNFKTTSDQRYDIFKSLILGAINSHRSLHGIWLFFDEDKLEDKTININGVWENIGGAVHFDEAPNSGSDVRNKLNDILMGNVKEHTLGNNIIHDKEGLTYHDNCIISQQNDSTSTNSFFFSTILWTQPFTDCQHHQFWFIAFYSVIYQCVKDSKTIVPKGFIEASINLAAMEIDQCGHDDDHSVDVNKMFHGTHRCPVYSNCLAIKNYGMRDGGYKCSCKPGYARLPSYSSSSSSSASSTSLSSSSRLLATTTSPQKVKKKESNHSRAIAPNINIVCVKCSAYFCHDLCDDKTTNCTKIKLPHISEYVVVTFLSVHVFVMFGVLLPAVLIVKMRKIKTIHFNFWQLYEVVIVGGLLIYLSVALEYLDATEVTCLFIPWLREIGFFTLYASVMLKVHRVRVECQSRQAQRVLLRDKDLVRYLAAILFLVTWQMVTWSVMHVESTLEEGWRVNELKMGRDICVDGWWHRIVQMEEMIFLFYVMYICCSSSSPPSFSMESRVITTVVINETIFSALYNVFKFVFFSLLNKHSSFVFSFMRCHLTVTVNLTFILVSKLWQAKMSAIMAATRRKDGGTSTSATVSGHSTSNNNKPSSLSCHETLKNQPSNISTSKKSQESGDILMPGLNHEEVKNEFKRIYKQLEAYKAKPSRKDAGQTTTKKQSASKKQGHRRFSLHNFHHNRHNKHHNTQINERNKCQEESVDKEQGAVEILKVTPEESSTSVEGRPATSAAGTVVTSGAATGGGGSGGSGILNVPDSGGDGDGVSSGGGGEAGDNDVSSDVNS